MMVMPKFSATRGAVSARILVGVKSGRVWRVRGGVSLRDQRASRVPCGAVSGARTGGSEPVRAEIFWH
jgi:hypothetical protein